MFHFEQSNKVSSSQINKRQAARRELIKRFKMYTKKSNHETKNILKAKLLPLKDKINLSVAEEALKVKVAEVSRQIFP